LRSFLSSAGDRS